MASAYNRRVLGMAIEVALRKKGWTQEVLAEHLGVAQQTISKWMKGETIPRPSALGRIEEALDVAKGEWIPLAYEASAARDEELDPRMTGSTRPAPKSRGRVPAALSGKWNRLSPEQRAAIQILVDGMLAGE